MALVLDGSVAVAWSFADEMPKAAHVLARLHDEEALVPSLWWFEVRNALLMNERRGRLGQPDTEGALRDLARLRIVIDHAPDEHALLALARRHGLTVYDAAYLELAQRESIPLATLDVALARAARALKISLV
jgi:predicted nucleic acid-binding protein